MKLKEAREKIEQQLQVVALEKQKTLDSLNLVAEPKQRKRVYELLQLQEQQQDALNCELKRVQEKEQKLTVQLAAQKDNPGPKMRIAVGIGFSIMMVLLMVALFQYQSHFFQSSPFLTGFSVGEIPTVEVHDKNNKEIGRHEVNFTGSGKYALGITIPDESDDSIFISGISITKASEITVIMDEAEITHTKVRAKADYYTGKLPERGRLKTKVVSVEGVGKAKATIRLPKSGKVNTIFRCDDFDQDRFECDGWEATDIPFTDDGGSIEFVVDHFSAYAAGEIVAIDAVHLDRNYTFISNIFDDIKTVDDVWSEPIAEGELVRVTFESNLTDGRIIDVFVRSSAGNPSILIYEAGTAHLVGQSDTITGADWKYMTVDGLTGPLDQFDLKIVGGNIEFDYIHDAMISDVHGGGMLVYQDSNTGIAKYREWTNANNLTDEASVVAHGGSDAAWLVLKSSHKRDEIIVGIEDAVTDLNLEVFNNTNKTGAWAAQTEVSVDVASSSSRRGFDLAYEDLSGDALIVFDNDSRTGQHDTTFQYILFNGTLYSERNNLTFTDANGVTLGGRAGRTVMASQPLTDTIMVLIQNTSKFLYGVPWTGDSFDTSKAQFISNATIIDFNAVIAFAWESDSGDGLAFYSNSSLTILEGRYIRPYSPSTGWGDEITVDRNGLAKSVNMCTDPFSDYIGIISQDTGNDINVTVWDGTSILTDGPAQDGAGTAPGSNNVNVDCAWLNSTSAMFGYSTDNDRFTYVFFHKPNTWSVSDLTFGTWSPAFTSGAIKSLQFFRDPLRKELMIIAVNTTPTLTMIRYNITNQVFQGVGESPIDTVDSANTEVAMFTWYRYDPGPNVTTMLPALNSAFNANDLIDIGGNVTDNLPLIFNDTIPMQMNITYPNGSNFTYTLSNRSGSPTKFNVTFSTAVAGVYTITFLANDTHKSLNYTEKTNFTITAAAESAAPLPLLISADIINLSSGTSSQGGGLVVSSTTNGFTNGTSLSAASAGASGLSVVNLSSGIININLSLLRNATHGNYPNVTFGWVLAKSNGSTMLNTTIQNNTANQSAFNYSFNANLLPDGIYNISVFVENISEGATRIVNYSRGFDIAIDRTAPNVTLTIMNTSNATSYRLGTTTEIQINVTLNDSTTSVPVVLFGIFSVGNGTEFNVTPTKQGSYWFVNLALGTLRSGDHIIRLYGNDTLGNVNNSVSNLSFNLNAAAPTAPLTGMPANGSALTNRTPIFDWFNSSDADGDVISYHIQVDDNARFNAPEINVSSIQDLSSAAPGNTTWYSSVELAVDIRFYWRVRANDSVGYGDWSNGATADGPTDAQNLSNFTIDSLLSITMSNSGIEFGTISPGTEANTSDGVPLPFRAENTGNIDANVSVNGSTLYTTVPINRSAYQFRIRANESNAFSTALSATGWTNMTNSTTAAHVVNLTWRNARNDFLTDLNLTIPTDEPSGFKTANITFTLTRNE